MEKWFVQSKKADFEKIGQRFQIDPVLARIIRNRDVVEIEDVEKYLCAGVESMYDPYLLKDMELSVEILSRKLQEQKRMRIISDYDVDGVISNYILLKGFRRLGAQVDYEIPDRIIDGYGINENLIQKAYDSGVDTIVTCDNGIAAIGQIAYAKSLGMTVVVTDHHDVPYEEKEDGCRDYIYSEADAVINPKQTLCTYPFPGLCGAGVAYKLVEAMYGAHGIPMEEAQELLEYAAIATVCDVVDLLDENRIIVKKGLAMLNQTSNQGLAALIRANGLEGKKIGAYHLGFVIGPCINASGRLQTAKRALELLLTDQEAEADSLALELKELNEERKQMTEDGLKEALEQVEQTSLMKDNVLVIYLPNCHESLAGIIAGRVRERYYRPVFVITRTAEGLKGSGRSIEAYSMFEEISKCKELFTRFGGHPMAAGLSFPEENLIPFRQKINAVAQLTKEDLVAKVSIDVPMPLDYISEGFVTQLDLLEPFGKSNAKPLFADRKLSIASGRILGKNQNVLKLMVKNTAGCLMEAMFFQGVDVFLSYLTDRFGHEEVDRMFQGRANAIELDCTYYPSINEFGGRRTLQIVIQNYR